jgi:hypothetical protein
MAATRRRIDPMKLFVATPAYGETVYTPYLRSMLQLQRALLKRGDTMTHVAISYAEVSEARNFLLTQWYDKSDASHILFVDADMGFDQQLVFDMLALNKPVVGTIYPRRQLDLPRLAQAAGGGGKAEEAIARGHDFILRALPAGKGRRQKGFMEVAGVGAGLLLVSRACIAQMLKKLPALDDKSAKKFSPLARDLDRLIRAFDPLTLPGGARLSEDYAFCHRWQQECGGEIWARFDKAITHVGPYHFSASYADAGAGAKQRVQVTSPAALAKNAGASAVTIKEGKGPKTVRGKLPLPVKGAKPAAAPKKNGGKPVRH